MGLFSGIGGFEEAFRRAGANLSAVCEIDPKCQSVLRRHFPEVEIIGNVKEVSKEKYPIEPDVITGGFPCQDLSVAGRRAGLDGERSGLWFEMLRIIEGYKPRWVVIENVPGLLSGCGCTTCQAIGRIIKIHRYLRRKRQIAQPCAVCIAGKRMLASHSGRNLTIILQGLVECGYGVCWRIFDAQYFGLAQRRERVFIVGCRDAGRAAEVLFEREGGGWDSPPRREAGKGIAQTITSGVSESRGVNAPGRRREDDYNLVAGTVSSKWAKGTGGPSGDEHYNLITHALRSEGHDASEDGTGRGTPLVVAPELSIPLTASGRGTERTGESCGQDTLIAFDARQNAVLQYGNLSGPLDSNGHTNGVCAFQQNASGELRASDVGYTLNTNSNASGRNTAQISGQFGVRRLMPIECERLQGFPDGWTATDGQGKEISDNARYRMLGNAVAVPVVEWIARRIVKADME